MLQFARRPLRRRFSCAKSAQVTPSLPFLPSPAPPCCPQEAAALQRTSHAFMKAPPSSCQPAVRRCSTLACDPTLPQPAAAHWTAFYTTTRCASAARNYGVNAVPLVCCQRCLRVKTLTTHEVQNSWWQLLVFIAVRLRRLKIVLGDTYIGSEHDSGIVNGFLRAGCRVEQLVLVCWGKMRDRASICTS